jgi:hypothetical protein
MNARVCVTVLRGVFLKAREDINRLKRKYQAKVGVFKGLECVKRG